MSYENFVQVRLAAELAVGATTATLVPASGAYRMPPADGGTLVLADSMGTPGFTEIVTYTSCSGSTLSGLVRAQEGTAARVWPAGTFCYQSLTAGDFTQALAVKAPLSSPAFTDNPTAPTPAAADNDTSIATTAFVRAAMALFGIGADVPLSTLANIDDKSLRGWRYVVDATAGTKPTPFGVVFTFGNTGDQIAQEFWEVTGGAASGTLRRWYRQVYGAGEWGTWRQLLHTGNILGAVSQSGGVPTGAIIERGSNANGEYVRFADGTQICTMLIQGGIAMGSYGSTGLYMGVLVCQFPAVFANAPSISGVSTDQNNLGWVTSNGIGQGVANIYHITASSTVTSTAIFLLAIGRWF